MPGSLFELRCPRCRTLHELSTGAGWCSDHNEAWGFEHLVCRSCTQLISRPSGCCHEPPESCPRCDGPLELWSGRVWLERTADGRIGEERVEGPCPRCDHRLTESDNEIVGMWD